MKFLKSKNVEYVGLMEEKLIEMGKELSYFRLMESIMKQKLLAEKHKGEREVARERNTACHHGKSPFRSPTI